MSELRMTARKGAESAVGLVEAGDGAELYVEVRGSGRPLVLVHGWTMSGAVWKKQAGPLSRAFTVVAPDLRGHGNSGKPPHGHTVSNYARDLRAVFEALDIRGAVLAGWSLGGAVVLEYWREFGNDRVSALAFVECTPAPMSAQAWNTHALRNNNFIGLHASSAAFRSNRPEYARLFVNGMFHAGVAPERDLQALLAEHMRTSSEAARAIFSDYALRDLSGVLPSITVPALALFGQGEHICVGEGMGRHFAEVAPDCELELFDKSGHMPFWEEPEKFNRAVEMLGKRLESGGTS